MWCTNCCKDVEPSMTLITPLQPEDRTIRQFRCPDCSNVIAQRPII